MIGKYISCDYRNLVACEKFKLSEMTDNGSVRQKTVGFVIMTSALLKVGGGQMTGRHMTGHHTSGLGPASVNTMHLGL